MTRLKVALPAALLALNAGLAQASSEMECQVEFVMVDDFVNPPKHDWICETQAGETILMDMPEDILAANGKWNLVHSKVQVKASKRQANGRLSQVSADLVQKNPRAAHGGVRPPKAHGNGGQTAKGRGRKLATVAGDRSLLVLMVEDDTLTTGYSEAQMSDFIFSSSNTANGKRSLKTEWELVSHLQSSPTCSSS